FKASEPALRAVSQRAVLVGQSGAGATAKMVNQLLMVAHMAGAAEALVYAESQGVDFGKVVEAINPQLAEDQYVKVFGERARQCGPDQIVPADKCHYTTLFLKDTKCMLRLGKKQPVAAAASLMLRSAVERATDGPFPWTFKTGLDALQ
ncbi:MAG: NAD-binding protein, partial [Chitinivibrionales bacterium]|nr:NAD-binding protein [Chitinivibrionales bacterium]